MKRHLYILLFVLISVNTVCFAQEKAIAPALESAVQKVAETMSVDEPFLRDPVALNAKIVFGKDRKQFAVVMKVRILRNWHIYAYVPKSQPYIETELKLSVPDGVSEIGEWKKPNAFPSSDGVFVYEGNLIFTKYFSAENIEKNSEITVGLYYQTCDLKQCLPPNTKMKKLMI